MKRSVLIGAGVAALALAASASADPRPQPKPQARSAERAGAPASYRTEAGHGYSARDRRMLDCLASDPRYDPRSDRIHVRPGVTRPCEVKTNG